VHVGTIRRGEVCQSQSFLAVGELKHGGHAFGFMCAAVKLPGSELIAGRGGSWKLFVYLVIDKKPLGSKCVPRAGTGNDQDE